MSIHLIVMAKAPVPGFAKTRLVPPLTPLQAAELAEAMLCDMLARPWGGFERHLCVSGESPHFEAAATNGWRLSKQVDGDLGARLEAASSAAFAAGATAVAFLGTDAPDLPDAFMADLQTALSEGAEVVLGPATDGGYYTLATATHSPLLFRDMPWSQPGLFEATVEAASAAGLMLHLLPPWSDVDEVNDLARFELRSSQSVLAGAQELAHLTNVKIGSFRVYTGSVGETLMGVEALTANHATLEIPAGATLFEQEAPADAIYLVQTGRVKLVRRVFREEHLVETLGPGGLLGEVALVAGATYSVSARALTPLLVARVPRERLESLLLERPDLALRLTRKLAVRVAHGQFRNALFSLRSLSGRLLLQLQAESERAPEQPADGLHQLPSDLPEALGAESALVDSNLRLLAADGLIALDGQGRFRIADRAAFERRLAFVELKDRFEP